MGAISKNIDEKIAECKAEIAEFEGDGTIISAIINFEKESGEALFSSASSNDNGKKNQEDKEKKLTELKAKLADLEKKKPQGQDGESSDSPDGLSEDELKGDDNPLADYVNKLKEDGTPYEVVRKGTMIGIKTTSRGGDPNSMSSMLKNMMEKVGGKLLGSPEDSSVDKTSGSALGEDVKSQVRTVIPSMKQGVSDFDDLKNEGKDNKSWYDDDQVLKAAHGSFNKNNSNAELFAATPINQNKEAIDLMHLQVSSAKETAAGGRTALMPVQIGGNHWVGGAMTKEGDEFKFIHNDPLGNKIDPNLRGVLESQGVDVIDLQHKQQTDAHNCGPYTADNLSKFAEAVENKGGLDLSSEQFKEKLKGELRSNGDQIREEQQGRGGFASPKTPPINSTSKGSEGRG